MPHIENVIQEELIKISTGALNGDPGWTSAIMGELTRLAYDNYNYSVYGQKCYMDDTITECLYDMVWYTPKPQDYLPHKYRSILFGDIHLVLECEWKKAIVEIMYDFQKLVQARAERRVMIFQADDTDKTMDLMTDYANSSGHSLSGDRYLFAGYERRDAKFKFRSFVKG